MYSRYTAYLPLDDSRHFAGEDNKMEDGEGEGLNVEMLQMLL